MLNKHTPDYVALYGNQSIQKGYCNKCKTHAFVIGGELQCCDTPYIAEPTTYKRESEPEFRRKLPSLEVRKLILRQQQHCCLYCGRMFGSYAKYKGRIVLLKIEWDHMVPFAYTQNNNTDNFAAACHICNALKHSMMFQDVEQAQVFLLQEWERKNLTESEVYNETEEN